MEIIHNNDQIRAKRCKSRPQAVYFGLLFILLGTAWLLYNLDIVPDCLFRIVFSWPCLIVIIGGYLLTIRRWAAGIAAITTGITLLMLQLFAVNIPLKAIIFPAAIIILGISLLFSRCR